MLVIFNTGVEDRNFYYLSGIEEPCKGVLLWDGEKPVVLASELEAGVAERYVEEVVVLRNRDELWDVLKRKLRGCRVVGVNMKKLPAAIFRKLRRTLKGKKVEDVSKKLAEMRKIKKEEEIRKIEKACKIASKALKKVPELLCEGMSERELAAEVEYIARKGGAQGFAFPTIVASGENSLKIHTTATERRIERGVVIVDIGPVYRMYGSDVTRTFCLGKNREFERIYGKVLEAEERVIEAVGEGKEAGKIVKVAEKLTGKMKHALGHGIGLEIHEEPVLHSKSRENLKAGEVLAVEPAIYSTFGVRIEDVLVVGKKARVLTEVPRDVEFVMI